MAAPIPSYNPFDDDDDSSAIMTTLFQLGVKCRVPGEDEDGISTSLLKAVGRMRKLFMKIVESKDNTATISDINEELTEVLKLVVMHQKLKAKNKHHQGVGFTEIANALDKVEKAIRLQDGVGFPNLNKNSPLSVELKEPMQNLMITRLKIYEEFHPGEYRPNGKISMKANGSVVKTQGGDIFSRSTGAVRYIIPKAHLISKGPVGSGNHYEGDDAVYNGPAAKLDAPDGILSGNGGMVGRSDFAGAEMSTGNETGTILCGNANTRTDNATLSSIPAGTLDPATISILTSLAAIQSAAQVPALQHLLPSQSHASQLHASHFPGSQLSNTTHLLGMNTGTSHAQQAFNVSKQGLKSQYNNNLNIGAGARAGSPGRWSGGSIPTPYGQQSNLDAHRRDDESMD